MQISIREAETHFSRLLSIAGEGQEIIITNAGRPVVRLVPMAEGRVRRVRGSIMGTATAGLIPLLPEDILPEFES